ncbi:hypothetical protein BCR15_04325 [Tessaracoccus lapidicaptus]|uniref:DUF2892 domain-containing protein n=1 Tax=Tessaracoccus lapidicaptus TaxID=1427523 RepID=A0A1C0ALW3_9ACTN|nr:MULTISPECIES: DUF2892 domain-containing protein [Tessaracoccus]AQX15497.1 hypothetical protein BKM78_05845 [Tessaracoccus sp. T2.5-30]OCL33865.1 hypothetical protein BCR15_04325 [Tessaracoccus lapidicaptus]VEP39820.1 hypothetical protein TLA_TLA_01182 [Tessaracoccus lapidicaptus]
MSNADHVRSSTDDDVQRRLDEERLQRVTDLVNAPSDVITRHIEDLDKAWDVERVLEANASSLILLSLGLSRVHSAKWLWLATAVPAFLLQHAIQGWCPPMEVIRRLGVRTRKEIEVERTALKALRGDFRDLTFDGDDPAAAARAALEAAEREQKGR